MAIPVFMLFVLIVTIIFSKLNYLVYSIVRFLLGFTLIHLCCDYYMDNGTFYKDHPLNAKEEAVIYVTSYIFYNLLFFSSLFLFLLRQENRKKNYFVIPIIVLVLILFVIIYIENSSKSLLFFGISLFLSFFPLYILSYYKKYKNEE